MAKVTKQLKLINLAPKATVTEARVPKTGKHSKSYTMMKLLQRNKGISLTALAAEMSKWGSEVTTSYCKAWLNYDLNTRMGFGLRSERMQNGDMRLFIIDPRIVAEENGEEQAA